MNQKTLKELIAAKDALHQGKVTPARIVTLSRRPDGTLKRILAAPAQREAWRSKAAQEWNRAEIQKARKQLHLSQIQFAKLLGVSVDTLQNWEQGRREPTGAAKVLLRIAVSNPQVVLAAA